MKRTLTITLLLALAAMTAVAQTPRQMLDKAVAAIKNAGCVTASYSMKGSQGASKGNITMSGTKFFLSSSDVKCWYDGSTMWTYSTMTDEVNITTPTAADMQMSNPYAAAQDFQRNYNMWKAAGQIPGCYAIMLRPKVKAQVRQVYLYIDVKTYLLRNVHVKMSDGSYYTITLTNYKTNQSVSPSTFTFNKSMVPAGTQVVDLR